MLITSTVEICIQHLGRVEEIVFGAWCSYASAVLGVVILSVCPFVRLSHACFVTNPKNLPAIFFIPHERAILLVKCDFSYSCASADKISTDLRARAVSAAAELLVCILFCGCWMGIWDHNTWSVTLCRWYKVAYMCYSLCAVVQKNIDGCIH